jgi:hypothetical protein
MHLVPIAALVFLLYANPFLIAALWINKLFGRAVVQPRWRSAMSWVSLIAATMGVASFWLTASSLRFSGSVNRMQRAGIVLSLFCALLGTLAGLFGKGKSSKWAAVSALLIPLNWIMWTAFQ